MKKQRKKWAAVLLAAMMFCSTAAAQQETSGLEEDFLIEDDGEVLVDNSGADLEELKEKERQESERAARESEEARIAQEEAEKAQKLLLEPADSQRILEHLERLTEWDSPTGSDGELYCVDYLSKQLEQWGYTISQQNFHEGFVNENGIDAPGINLIAERGADTEKRTDDILVIAAHYDSKTNPEEGDPFANEKSGAALLLELARILSYEETDTDICFVFLSGEEDGLYGSQRFAEFMKETFQHRIAGVLYIEEVGYPVSVPYGLKTWDGKENSVGLLLQEKLTERLLTGSEEMIGKWEKLFLSDSEELDMEEYAEGEEGAGMEEVPAWSWAEDQETSQYRFAQAEIEAVTVCQLFSEKDLENLAEQMAQEELETETVLEETDEIPAGQPDPEILAELTDLLASSIGEIMQENE